MILIGIDIGKLSHTFCIMDKYTGELIIKPTNIKNDKNGFDLLLDKVAIILGTATHKPLIIAIVIFSISHSP